MHCYEKLYKYNLFHKMISNKYSETSLFGFLGWNQLIFLQELLTTQCPLAPEWLTFEINYDKPWIKIYNKLIFVKKTNIRNWLCQSSFACIKLKKYGCVYIDLAYFSQSRWSILWRYSKDFVSFAEFFIKMIKLLLCFTEVGSLTLWWSDIK